MSVTTHSGFSVRFHSPFPSPSGVHLARLARGSQQQDPDLLF